MNTVVSFFQNGGSFMYPIAVVLVIGLALSIERWVFLMGARSSNRKATDRILPLLKEKDYSGIREITRKNNTPVGRIVTAGLARLQRSSRRDEVEYAMEEIVMETVPRLEKRTSYISTLANIATLLGLLGTIMGLIAAFTAVATAEPSEKASLLSQSISVAMNTTAFGLISAIPLLLLHSMIMEKTTEIVDSLEMSGTKFLNILANTNAFAARSRSSDKQG
ncbi:MAG: biopolymer transport protein ExbB [Flavobacteriales bacterium]|jgi:biopolymer transport protein ExbB